MSFVLHLARADRDKTENLINICYSKVWVAGHLSRTLQSIISNLEVVNLHTQQSNENIYSVLCFMNFQSSSLVYFSDMEEQLLSFSCKRNIFI